MRPEDQYNVDNYQEQSEADRQWFFDVNGRFPATDNELENFLEMKLEDLAISTAEDLAAEDLLEE